MVPGLPKCLWLPPPWGWSTGFILTPFTLGKFFFSLAYLWQRAPALMIGFSVLPPPPIIPTVALHWLEMVFLTPDGSLILVLAPSSECPIMVAQVPEALENVPLSPVLASMLQIVVPSGIELMGNTFPTATVALVPQKIYCPEYVPSAAKKYSMWFLYLYGSLNSTLASGAPLPGSWTMALTTPLMYPFLSEQSRVLQQGAATLWCLWDLKTPLGFPFLWHRMTLPIQQTLLLQSGLIVYLNNDLDIIIIQCYQFIEDIGSFGQVWLEALQVEDLVFGHYLHPLAKPIYQSSIHSLHRDLWDHTEDIIPYHRDCILLLNPFPDLLFTLRVFIE